MKNHGTQSQTRYCKTYPVFLNTKSAMVVYSKKQLRELRARKRYGRNMKISGALEAGWSAKRIAREFGLSYSWSKKLCRSIKNGADTERKGGSGRKSKTSPREDRFLVRRAKVERPPEEDCPRTKDLAEELKEHSGTVICGRTVRRRLHAAGLKKTVKTRKPFINSRNQAIRLKFAREHLNWTVEDWKKVLWTDESPYVLRCMLRQFVWRTPGEKFTRRCMQGTVKHQKKINVWGCFSWNGVGSLYRINGIMDRFLYRQILIRQMRPSGRRLIGEDFILAQDNDPKHTSVLCRNYLSNQNIRQLNWPAQSPDLNPIENLWSELDRRMRKRKCNNEDELFEEVLRCWQALDVEYLRKLISSMPRRCADVVRNNGRAIDY